jgi:hypothetical protein
MKITSFRNCANPDCPGHHRPIQYEEGIPLHIEKLRSQHASDLLLCPHCGTIWLEHLALEGQTCYIVRRPGTFEWLQNPVVQRYELKKPRKTLSPRRLR